MKKLFLIRALTVFIPLSLCAFTGCETTKSEEIMPYHARIGLGGDIMFKEEFLKANRLYGEIYKNDNWDPEDASSKEYLADETSQIFRTYIITDKAQLDEIFSVYPDIDFKKEMVVMYAYSSIYNNIHYQDKLISITLANKHLKIEFKIVGGKPGYGIAHMPQRTFLPIKMDKLDIETIEFTQLH